MDKDFQVIETVYCLFYRFIYGRHPSGIGISFSRRATVNHSGEEAISLGLISERVL